MIGISAGKKKVWNNRQHGNTVVDLTRKQGNEMSFSEEHHLAGGNTILLSV